MEPHMFERKEELIEAALDEFTSKSYGEASLNQIIKKAGISKGTFYYHFENKESLYLYLLHHSVTAKWQFIEERSKEEHRSTEILDIFERFKFQARLGIEFGKLFPKYHKLSIMFAKEKGKEICKIASEVLETDSEKVLEDMIDKAMKDGDFRKDLPAEFVHNIVSYLLMHYTDVFQQDEDMTLNKMLENIDYFVDFLKNGIGKNKDRR